jgi:hypothetical protein
LGAGVGGAGRGGTNYIQENNSEIAAVEVFLQLKKYICSFFIKNVAGSFIIIFAVKTLFLQLNKHICS